MFGPNCFLEIRDESNYDNGSDFKIESKLNKILYLSCLGSINSIHCQ